MKKIITIIFLIISFSSHSFGQSTVDQAVPLPMIQFLEEIKSLQPYMISEKDFLDSKNDLNIRQHLETLAEIGGKLQHEKRLSTPFFQIMTEILPGHLEGVKNNFKNGHKKYSRTMLNATLNACTSCHSQVQSRHANLWKFTPDAVAGGVFEKANFLYSVRQYDEALNLYKRIVTTYKAPTKEPFSLDVQEAMFRKLDILIRGKRDLVAAQKDIEKDLLDPHFPELIRDLLKSELESVKQMQTISPPNLAKSKSREVEDFAAKTLSKYTRGGWVEYRNPVPQMYVSSILYDFSQQHTASEVGPGVYYWLAKCEKRLSKNYFFPLTEIYLKECINRYPSSYEAKLCFSDLEDLVVQDYTGSMGTSLPAENVEELNNFRKTLGDKPKSYPSDETNP